MRPACLLLLLSSSACYSPDAVSPGDTETGSTGGESSTGPSMTSAAVDSSTSTPPTDEGSSTAMADSGTTAPGTSSAMDSTGSDESGSSTSDTGSAPGCGGFDGRVIYVNMSGAELTMGIVDNAPSNITSNVDLVGTWPGYSTADADQVYELVAEHWAPYDVCLTRDPPAVADYTMIVVSSETFQNPNFIGFGDADCSDSVLNSVNVVVLSEEAGLAVATKAIGISKHIAHTFGLNSVVDAPDDLMNQFVGITLNGATFTDPCHAIVTQTCDAAVTCAAGEQQSGPYLEMLLGPA